MLTNREYEGLISLVAFDLTDEELLLLMDQKVDFSNGGTAVVMVGNTGLVQEFATNPRVKFIECTKLDGNDLQHVVPDNTRAVIITDGIPTYHHTWIHSFCRRKNVPYLVRKSNQAIYELLKQWFADAPVPKVTPQEAKDTFVKGKLDPLIPMIDFKKSNSENARNLLRHATEMGISSTLGSLAQLVANQRRKTGQSDIPKSVRLPLDLSVEMLDKAIEDLTSMRDFLIATTEENRMLKIKLGKLTEAFREMV